MPKLEDSTTSTKSFLSEINKGGDDGMAAQNSFSADSPYFSSFVDNEIRRMAIMHETLHDIAANTKSFGKTGLKMSEATRRLALSCRLRRPYSAEDEKELNEKERRERADVHDRRRAIGEEMASILVLMAEVRSLRRCIKCEITSREDFLNLKVFVGSYCFSCFFLLSPTRCWKRLRMRRHRCVNPSRRR